LPKLWALCRERGYGVVADVHVHPGSYRQSTSDRDNPVMPRAGHIAMILPDFARAAPEPGRIGIYEFERAGVWTDHSAKGLRFVKLERRA
jgi:proteasome lid subunit RPN8/RPN11